MLIEINMDIAKSHGLNSGVVYACIPIKGHTTITLIRDLGILTDRQIRIAIKKLEKANLIDYTMDINNPLDRTKQYIRVNKNE